MSSKNVCLNEHPAALGLEEKIGYRFKNHALLEQALTHSSYAHERQTEANERLALLGDSLLNAAVTWTLYQKDPSATPGTLTERRKAYVSQEALVGLAKTFGLEGHLFLGKGGKGASPRMLAGAFESLVGALFVDGGFGELFLFLDRVIAEMERKKTAC